MKEIQLTQGKVALVDDKDFEALNQFKWTACKGKNIWYAQRKLSIKNKRGNRIKVKMHREILGLGTTEEDDIMVDHKDHNGLNNQRDNLRPATPQQNMANARNRVGCISNFKGVTFRGTTWVARIGVGRKRLYLGSFKTEVDAALAYNEAAKKHFGDFAHLNSI